MLIMKACVCSYTTCAIKENISKSVEDYEISTATMEELISDCVLDNAVCYQTFA